MSSGPIHLYSIDRIGIHEVWLTNRFEHADTPDPITITLNIEHYTSQLIASEYKVMLLTNQKSKWSSRVAHQATIQGLCDVVGVSACSNLVVNHASSLSCLPFHPMPTDHPPDGDSNGCNIWHRQHQSITLHKLNRESARFTFTIYFTPMSIFPHLRRLF